MTLTVLVPPAGEPVALSAAKAFLRIGHDGEDGLVADLIAAARARVEQVSGLALVERTLRAVWTGWPTGISGRGARLPVGPVTQLISVRTIDDAGAASEHVTRFELSCGRIVLSPWSALPWAPPGGRVEIDFVAGYGQVPEDLAEAVLRTAGHAYVSHASSGVVPGQGEGALPPEVAAILNARRQVRI